MTGYSADAINSLARAIDHHSAAIRSLVDLHRGLTDRVDAINPATTGVFSDAAPWCAWCHDQRASRIVKAGPAWAVCAPCAERHELLMGSEVA